MLGELAVAIMMEHNESNDTGMDRLPQAQIKATHLILSFEL